MVPCCFLSPDTDLSDIVHSLGSMNILWELFNDSDYVSVAPHSAALNVFALESGQVRHTLPKEQLLGLPCEILLALDSLESNNIKYNAVYSRVCKEDRVRISAK